MTKQDSNNEIQLTDAIKLSLENGNIIIGHVLDGRRIDVGGWDYLRDERDFYINRYTQASSIFELGEVKRKYRGLEEVKTLRLQTVRLDDLLPKDSHFDFAI